MSEYHARETVHARNHKFGDSFPAGVLSYDIVFAHAEDNIDYFFTASPTVPGLTGIVKSKTGVTLNISAVLATAFPFDWLALRRAR